MSNVNGLMIAADALGKRAAAGRPHHLPPALHARRPSAPSPATTRTRPSRSPARRRSTPGPRRTARSSSRSRSGAAPGTSRKPGEDMHAAVARECRATRASLGIFDASTLGKIEVVGPDAVDLHGADVHQPLGQARRRPLPLRPPPRRGRLHPRRRRDRPAGRRPLPRHHHHRRRGARPQHDGGLPADRMARPRRSGSPRPPSSGRRSR